MFHQEMAALEAEAYAIVLGQVLDECHSAKAKQNWLRLLVNHLASPDRDATATDLAAPLGRRYQFTNLWYGKLGWKMWSRLQELGLVRHRPEYGVETLVEFSRRPDTRHLAFIMRPQLVYALETLRWFPEG